MTSEESKSAKPNDPVSNKDGYDQWSKFYDTYPNPTVATDEKSFPSFWHHHHGQKILEIGCGTGRHTQKLVAHQNRVTALDLSPGMLKVAREKIPSPLVTFIEADLLTYDNLESNFDVVIESLVLEHLQDLGAFFKKAARALKTGGDLYISEIHPARTEKGILAHFKVSDDEEVHLTSHAHREQDFLQAAQTAGLRLLNNVDVKGDEDLARLNPKWSKHLGHPLIKIMHFAKE